ncbi:tetratricopeptide repeat protein [Ramlibacter sp. Leaf400]|uniref:tetratricopeptide repeat protein n=1 Tax=Ramlibacter sp. Leaf400 TaxID=1736365 RepID=UPI00138F71CC|nr:tetratricopeptide repeat protein [Ramlibacter sp. Leaf400]
MTVMQPSMKSRENSENKLYEQALRLATRKKPDLAQAKGLLETAHVAGDRRATYALATWLLTGNTVCSKDVRAAVRLLKLAAEADIAPAHFDLAVSHETGQGTRKNEKAAYRHFVAAALNGDDAALAEVGRCLYHGIGVGRDRKLAEVWFRRADMMGISIR